MRHIITLLLLLLTVAAMTSGITAGAVAPLTMGKRSGDVCPSAESKFEDVETANKWFKEQELLDQTYPLSDGVTEEMAKQFKREWAETRNHTALMALAQAYLFGNDYIEPDLSAALEYIKAGVELGIPRAHALMGFLVATGRAPAIAGEGPLEELGRALLHYKFAEVADDPIGIAVMAYRTRYGRGVPRSCRQASELYSVLSERMAANQPDEAYLEFHPSYIDLNLDTLWSTPSSASMDDYLHHYEYLGDAGDANALSELGRYYMLAGTDKQDYARAREILQEAVGAGSAAAKAHLGYLYQHGLGVEKDPNEALRLYREAAAGNSSEGLTLLGRLYTRTDGPVEQDVPKGIELLEKATRVKKGGYPPASLELGDIYRDGRGTVKPNRVLAAERYSLASFGSKAALHELGMIQLDDNCELAVGLLKAAAEYGTTFSEVMDQGDSFFEAGQYAKALPRFELAAEMGNEVAQTNAAFMYLYDLTGDAVPLSSTEKSTATDEGTEGSVARIDKDEEEEEEERLARKYKYCFYYYKAKAQQEINMNKQLITDATKDVHQGDSFVRLGDMFYYGHGVAQNYTIAAGFYKHVAERNSQAAFNLGYMYQFGIGVPKDLYMAKRLYDSSSALVQNRLAVWPALVSVFVMHCHSYLAGNPDVAVMGLLGALLLPLLWYRHFREMRYIRVPRVRREQNQERDQ